MCLRREAAQDRGVLIFKGTSILLFPLHLNTFGCIVYANHVVVSLAQIKPSLAYFIVFFRRWWWVVGVKRLYIWVV